MSRDVKLFEPPKRKYFNLGNKRKPVEREFLAKFGLMGFGSDSSTIKLDSNHVIKRVSKEERESFYGRINHRDKEYFAKEYSNRYEFMLHYYYKSKKQGFAFHCEASEKATMIEAFSMIFLNHEISLQFCNEFVKKGDSFKSLGFLISPKKDLLSDDFPIYSKSDSKRIKALWKIFTKEKLSTIKAVKIALWRLNFSHQRNNQEDKIIDLTIACEALFLKENAELNHRLALRISKLLEPDYPNILVYDFVKRAYGIRSKVAHGNSPLEKDYKFNNYQYDLSYFNLFLFQILKISLIKYFTEFKSISTVDFIDRIDKAVISSKPITDYYVK